MPEITPQSGAAAVTANTLEKFKKAVQDGKGSGHTFKVVTNGNDGQKQLALVKRGSNETYNPDEVLAVFKNLKLEAILTNEDKNAIREYATISHKGVYIPATGPGDVDFVISPGPDVDARAGEWKDVEKAKKKLAQQAKESKLIEMDRKVRGEITGPDRTKSERMKGQQQKDQK